MSIFSRAIERARGASALYDLHPELEDREHVLRIVSGEEGYASRGRYGYAAAGYTYTSNVWVNKAGRILADNFAPIPVRVVNTDTGKPIKAHAITDLFNYVNEKSSPAALWREYALHMMLGGEDGLELVKGRRFGQYVEVWPRSPDQFNVIPDEDNRRYHRVAGYRIKLDPSDKGFKVPADEFIHTMFFNPLSAYRGISPIAAARNGIVIDQLAQAWSAAFFSNSARPDYAVVAPTGTTKTERDEIEAKLQAKYGGTQNAHRPIAIEDGVIDIKPLSFPPKDIEWIQQREMSRDEIAGVMGVPDELMGFGKDTYENFKTAMRAMVTLTLVPLWGHRDSTLTKFFRGTGDLRGNESIISDLSGVPELQQDLRERIDMYVSLVRDAGEDPEVADAFLRLGLAGARESVGQTNAIRVFGPIRPAALPEPEEPEPDPDPSYPAYGSPEHLGRMAQIEQRVEPHIRRFKRTMRTALRAQEAAVLKAIDEGDEFLAQDGPELAGLSDLFNLNDEIDRFKNSFKRLITSVFEDSAAAESTLYGLDELDPESPEAVSAIEEVLLGFAKKTNNTTYKDLTDLIQQAKRDNLSAADVKGQIKDYFDERRSGAQLDRTARTTLTATNNAATDAVYFQDPTVKGAIWVAQFRNTRDAHAAAHGQRKNKNGFFGVGGEYLRYPGDPKGSAGNVINCQCGMVPDLGMKQEAIKWTLTNAELTRR